MIHYAWTDSPTGAILVAASDAGVVHCGWQNEAHPARVGAGWRQDPQHPVVAAAVQQLGQYFAKQRKAFDLPLAPEGTAFQQAVWQQIAGIGFGRTRTYGEIAAAIGKPQARRAVGAATGRNPLGIIVPCHRVVGAGGALTGFGGGLPRKVFLLDLEKTA